MYSVRSFEPHRAVLWLGFCLSAAPGCSSSAEPGVSVDLVSSSAPVEAGALTLDDERTELQLSSAVWTNAEIEIVACPSLARRLGKLVVATAWAHGSAAPTRSAVPVIQSASLLAAVDLGTLTPPAGDYCSAIYRIGPADADAVGIADNPDMLGFSVRVRGVYRRDGGPWQDFAIESQATRDILGADLTLELTRPGAAATLRVERDIDQWFRGIDFETIDGSSPDVEQARESRLLDNIVASTHIEVE
jgi:hypothetical protein